MINTQLCLRRFIRNHSFTNIFYICYNYFSLLCISIFLLKTLIIYAKWRRVEIFWLRSVYVVTIQIQDVDIKFLAVGHSLIFKFVVFPRNITFCFIRWIIYCTLVNLPPICGWVQLLEAFCLFPDMEPIKLIINDSKLKIKTLQFVTGQKKKMLV